MARLVVTASALVLAIAAHLIAAGWTFIGTCSISDTADRVPAPASIQGRICDGQDHWLNVTPFVVLGGSYVLAVVLAVVLWNRRGRWVGLTAGVWLAVVSTVLLALPSDSCGPAQVRDEPAWACDTRGNG